MYKISSFWWIFRKKQSTFTNLKVIHRKKHVENRSYFWVGDYFEWYSTNYKRITLVLKIMMNL